jgi:hypothetical protein
MDVAAAAALATNGVFAPLLLTDRAEELPDPLESYLLDIQPGYQEDPRQGVYNRVWLLGDVETISPQVQGRLDELTELIPVEPEPAADRRSGGGGQDGDAAPGGGGGPPGPPAAPGGGGPGGRGPGSGPGPGNSR